MGIFYFENSIGQSLIYKQFDSDDGIASSEVFDINQDKYGQIWFGTNHGLSSYNLKKFKNWGINEGLPNDLVTRILFDKKGKMWLLTFSNGIYYFDEEKQYFFEAGFNNELKRITHKKFISQIVFEKSGKIWLVARHEEIYSITNNKLKLECNLMDMPHNFGFMTYNISDNLRLYANLVSNDNKPKPLKLEIVNSKISKLYYDKPINIIGSVGIKLSNGDELICYKNDLIRYKNNKILTRYTIGNAFVMRVYEDKNHNIWLCTQVGGLFKFNSGILDKEHCEQFFSGQTITNLFTDRNENLWVGSVGFGTYLITHSEIIRYIPEAKVKDLTKVNAKLYAGSTSGKIFEYAGNGFIEKFFDNKIEIRQVIRHKNKPLLLYSTFSEKVVIDKNFPSIKAKSGIIVGDKVYSILNTMLVYDKDLQNKKEIAFPSKTICILKLNETSMLVGTQMGLYKFMTDGSFSPFSNNKLLQSNTIETLAQDSIYYYVSIRDKGFYFINKKTLQIGLLKNNVLTDHLISSVFIEGEANIWLCASSGCYQFKYSGKRKQFELTNDFSIKNGIISGDVNKLITCNGFYYIATTKGVYKIPLDFKIRSSKSTLYFENLKSKNYVFLNRPAFNCTINPPKKERTIEVDFANISFFKTNPAYRYRLKKGRLAGEWNTTNSELIQLINLTNGNYLLEVSACDGMSNTAVLKFIIPPMFKETIWFTLLLIFLITSTIIIIVYQVFRFQKTRRNLAESRLLAMQTKLNPHFIFNSLNSMQHLLFDNNFETSNKYLTAFSGLMRKCFEFADKDFIPLYEEIKFIEKYLEIEQINTPFDYKIKTDKDLDLFKTQIPPLFLQPIIENCIKHGFKNSTKNFLLNVSLKPENKTIHIEIENNGAVAEINTLNKKDGSLAVLNKRIEHLRSIYKNNTFNITFNVVNDITRATIILPLKKSY